jgi:hypothetical protein
LRRSRADIRLPLARVYVYVGGVGSFVSARADAHGQLRFARRLRLDPVPTDIFEPVAQQPRPRRQLRIGAGVGVADDLDAREQAPEHVDERESYELVAPARRPGREDDPYRPCEGGL